MDQAKFEALRRDIMDVLHRNYSSCSHLAVITDCNTMVEKCAVCGVVTYEPLLDVGVIEPDLIATDAIDALPGHA